ncbi:MAG TPA: hypothetical protein VFC17_09210, partial [Candidatus Limnocylindrales bacterium]|nr:hypothetical protein [Candidatus Limnocylindrales bacterium]
SEVSPKAIAQKQRALTGKIFTLNRPASVRIAVFRVASPITKQRPQSITVRPQWVSACLHVLGVAPL